MNENRGKTKYRRKRIFLKQKGKCNLCRNKLGKLFCLDHKIPLGLGGTNDDNNLQVLCINCNIKKTQNDLLKIWAYRKHKNEKKK